MLRRKRMSVPPRPLAWHQAEEMVERTTWTSERDAEPTAECLAYQRLRAERRSVAEREERLAQGRAELESDRSWFAVIAALVTILLVVAALAVWMWGGSK